MIWGDGVLDNIVIWQPKVKGKRNSNAQPYVCARGKNDTSGSPGLRGILFCAYLTFAARQLCVIITPFEKPVVPEV